MAYRDMRDLLPVLEQRGRLRRIAKPVDKDWEISCLSRWLYQAFDEKDRFGLLFENVDGFDMPVAAGVIGSSREAYAIALGVEPDAINARWVEALRAPIAPAAITAATSQEVVLTGSDADLMRLPIPVWTPGKDVAPYVTAPVITRDHSGETYNVGVYRTQLRDGHSLAVNLQPRRHGRRCVESFLNRGEPAPIAWVIGAEPAVQMAAVANVPWGLSEITIGGGLKGEPVEMVRARTIDLMVPANAEIVIEAEIHPGETGSEGPFGEFAGYMGGVGPRPVAKITAITHRRNPTYYGIVSQMPPSESTFLQSIGYAGTMMKLLTHDLGYDAVRDFYVDLTFGGQMAHGVVQLARMSPGHSKMLGRLIADVSTLKRITLVDEDVDIRDPDHVAWAMNARFNPARDTVLIGDVVPAGTIDPTIRFRDGVPEMSSKIVCDATEKGEPGPLSIPSREMMERALESWNGAGLPAIEMPRRMALMLDRKGK